MRTSNPALAGDTFQPVYAAGGQTMTVRGTVNKTAILLALAALSGSWTWGMAMRAPAQAFPWMMGGALGGLVVALLTVFNKTWAPVTAPLYAVLEGLFLGAISALYEIRFQGLVLQAAMLTFGTLFALLAAYRSGWIRATEKFKMGVVAATGGIFLLYLVAMVLGFFGVHLGFMYNSGPMSILLSVVIVIVAALNLVLDFDFIEQGAQVGAPKYLEWYGGFGLLVTLVWLYLEILRLLAKLNSRRN
jgi:uncharacterized YccA/Bax inhibitor family protein